jgi:hypothetical protein
MYAKYVCRMKNLSSLYVDRKQLITTIKRLEFELLHCPDVYKLLCMIVLSETRGQLIQIQRQILNYYMEEFGEALNVINSL